jgi:tRNA modification GTPase
MNQQRSAPVTDTVVARATPEGEGGLAVVRLSGPEAMAIARRVFRGPGFGPSLVTLPAPRRAVYGILHMPIDVQHDENQQVDVIDEALALPLPGPHSYTGEDTVEFFCHGGRQVAAAVVRACQAAGAVAAPPGEFTRRAFLNGRLTLDQAEAVADLITAGSEQAARAAVAQLRGGLDAELGAVEWPLLDLLVRLEGSLEFSDDDGVSVPVAEVRLTLAEAVEGIDRLLALAPAGRLLREGIHLALAGAPNAGKSSLFNRLVGDDRALVDAEPGTTRDVVAASVRRGGRLYVLHDTAGLRDEAGRVESMGIARARETAAGADLVLLLAEAGQAWPSLAVASHTPVLRVATKGDLGGGPAGEPTCAGASHDGGGTDADPAAPGITRAGITCAGITCAGITCAGASRDEARNGAPIVTSAVTGVGLDELWAAIEHQAEAWNLDEAVSLGVVLNERHRQRLLEGRDELSQLLALYDDGADPGDEVAGTLLAATLARLGEISGRVFSEQLLDGVFRRFCVGK